MRIPIAERQPVIGDYAGHRTYGLRKRIGSGYGTGGRSICPI